MPEPSRLADIVLTPEGRGRFVADTLALIDDHVAHRGGFRGISLKTGLRMLKATRPDMLPRAVDKFVPLYLEALDPLYRECVARGEDFGRWMVKRDAAVTEAMIAAADRRVATSTNPAVHSYYKRFRSTAEEEVRRAVPALAELLGRYLREASR